ncbi:hypothetical protein O181_023993 [Austropuccinia psidii MF-1]|uniref:Uncharacterized protein n=1 Tax=Austropuccinia psidii MF-1 TaxID=1389203 RepID=A0A9Q3CI33_9BASI|nr:hypothetical protein [Austropuccinia psidii MF-1]
MPTISYACPDSQNFTREILTPVQVPNNLNNCLRWGSLATAPTLPYVGAGAQRFTRKSLCLFRFPTIQTIPYAGVGFQCFKRKSLGLYRFPTLHTLILTIVQVPNNSDDSLHRGSLPTIFKIP